MVTEPVKVYTRNDPPCNWCTKAKNMLSYYGISYENVIIGEDIKRSEFMEKFPEIYSVPAIFFGEKYIGGYKELEQKIWTIK